MHFTGCEMYLYHFLCICVFVTALASHTIRMMWPWRCRERESMRVTCICICDTNLQPGNLCTSEFVTNFCFGTIPPVQTVTSCDTCAQFCVRMKGVPSMSNSTANRISPAGLNYPLIKTTFAIAKHNGEMITMVGAMN